MNQSAQNWKHRSTRDTLRLMYWTVSWVASTALAAFGPEFIWSSHQTLTLAAIALCSATGLGMILAYKRYLAGMDELQRKVQLEAMAIALGTGVIFGISYSLMDSTQVITSDAEIAHIVILMSLIYIISIAVGTWKYR